MIFFWLLFRCIPSYLLDFFRTVTELELQKRVKKCSVVVKDIRKHPWWGPKVRQLDGEHNTVIRPRILKRNFLDFEKLQPSKYTSVLIFHLDLKRLIYNAQRYMPMQSEAAVKNILASYSANVRQVFPWFDDETPLAHYEPIEADLVQCYGDHFYAAKTKKLDSQELTVCLQFL